MAAIVGGEPAVAVDRRKLTSMLEKGQQLA
jgi:hypothetical protein